TDPSLSVTTAKKEFHLSRCFFLLFSDLDRWLPHRNDINDGLPALACHRCIGCGSSAIRRSLISFSDWMICFR
ncbi:hypothetical protein MUK42_08910, partial [Musa troglodytarum]